MSTPEELAATEAAAPTETTPPAEATAPAEAAPAEEAAPQRSDKDLARDAIYARATASRAQSGDESTEAMREGVRQMIEGTEGLPILQAAPPANLPPPPIAQTPEVVTLLVEGRQITVAAADVMREGVRTLQKQSAADMRLQRAAQVEQQLVLDKLRLDAREAEIKNLARLPPQGAAPPAEAGTLSSDGQPDPAGMKKGLDALLDSDTDGAAKAFSGFVTEQVKAEMRKAQAQAPKPESTPAVIGEIPAPWSQDEKDRANQVFETAFPDILTNKPALAYAANRMKYEMDHPVNRMGKVDLVVLAARIGQEMRQQAAATVPQPSPQANSADELAARRSLAARVPGVPPSSVPRSVGTPSTESKPPSRSETVQQMKRQRGQA